MMGRREREQGKLFYEFNLDEMVPTSHLLRRINVIVTAVLADLHEQLKPFYSDLGRPSVDPELMIRMLIVGYCYGIRHERKLCDEVALHLAYRWFCKMDLEDKVPHHSTFSINRLGRFRESDILRHIFERVVAACMAAGLVKGEGFAVDASVMEANASRYHGVPPDEIAWSDAQKQKRAVAEYLDALDAETSDKNQPADGEPPDDAAGEGRTDTAGPETPRERRPERKAPKVISPSDPFSAWTAKANKRVQFGYGLNYLIDVEHAVIVEVEATPARTFDEVAATKMMIDRAEQTFDLKPKRLPGRAGSIHRIRCSVVLEAIPNRPANAFFDSIGHKLSSFLTTLGMPVAQAEYICAPPAEGWSGGAHREKCSRRKGVKGKERRAFWQHETRYRCPG